MGFLFDEKYRHPFHLFGWLHILVLATAIAAIVTMYRFRGVLKRPTPGRIFRYSVASLLVVFETTFQIWMAKENGFNWVDATPLGLCAMMEWITVVALVLDLKNVIKVVLPWAFVGASLSFVVVNMGVDYTIPHFRFFHYFGIHFLFLAGNLYYLFTERFTYRYKDLLRSTAWLAGVSAVVLAFDRITDQNFMFLVKWPDELDFVNNVFVFPLNTLMLVLSAFLLFNVFYALIVKRVPVAPDPAVAVAVEQPVEV
jgi:hypothetical integral membrane protein (TIGR02206 family)